MTRFIFLLFFKYSPRDGPLKIKKSEKSKKTKTKQNKNKKQRDLFFFFNSFQRILFY